MVSVMSFALELQFSKTSALCWECGADVVAGFKQGSELMFRQKTEEVLQSWTRASEKEKE